MTFRDLTLILQIASLIPALIFLAVYASRRSRWQLVDVILAGGPLLVVVGAVRTITNYIFIPALGDSTPLGDPASIIEGGLSVGVIAYICVALRLLFRPEPIPPIDLAAVVAASRDATVVADMVTGRIMSWNPAAERLLGRTAEDAIGQQLDIIVHPDLRDAHLAGVRRWFATHESALVDGDPFGVPAVHADGTTVDVSLRLIGLDDRYVAGVMTGGGVVMSGVRSAGRSAAGSLWVHLRKNPTGPSAVAASSGA